jgi:hypothetical protein
MAKNLSIPIISKGRLLLKIVSLYKIQQIPPNFNTPKVIRLTGWPGLPKIGVNDKLILL